MTRTFRFAAAALLTGALVGIFGPAQADLTYTASVGGAVTGTDVTLLNFDSSPLPSGITLSLTGGAEEVTGSVSGQYAAPYFSNGDGLAFGDGPANGPDTSQYVAVLAGGQATLSFATPQSYIGLLWGSVDTYNTLVMLNGTTVVGELTGSQITADDNGDQGADGTLYVNIDSSTPFTSVEFLSSQNSFEFDDVAASTDQQPIPEPASLALVGAAIFCFGLLNRRRKS